MIGKAPLQDTNDFLLGASIDLGDEVNSRFVLDLLEFLPILKNQRSRGPRRLLGRSNATLHPVPVGLAHGPRSGSAGGVIPGRLQVIDRGVQGDVLSHRDGTDDIRSAYDSDQLLPPQDQQSLDLVRDHKAGNLFHWRILRDA